VTEEQQQEIFKDWLQHHDRAIFKIVRAYADNAMDRDDLFQDIAIQVWHSIPVFKAQSSVITWIYRIALNTALKWVRKEKSRPTLQPLENAGHILNEAEENVDEQLKWLYREIYSLDLIDRCVVLLLLDNFSYKEMAVILGISESNVGVKINRIKKQLQEKSKPLRYGV
jgi:RNA polymerase sigma-70 factor (ECF subfamily)